MLTHCTVTLTDRKPPNLQHILWWVTETETVAVDTPKEDESPFIHANAPVQRRAAQRSVRCNRLLGGTVSSGSLHFGLTRTMSARMATRLVTARSDACR